MKKNLLLVNVSLLVLLLSSCSSSQNTSTAPKPAPPSPRATPTAKPSPSSPPETVAQVPSNQLIPVVIPPGIEPSTNPQQRLSEIAKGRRDPFAAISIKPKVIILPTEDKNTGGGTPTGGGGAPTGSGAPTGGGALTGGGAPTGGNNVVKGPIKGPKKPGEKMPPSPPPEPDIAEAVVITGIVELNGTPYAIIQSPEEPFSRYVQSGQYLAQGQVLVKRIDAYAGTPSVVLEQYGVRVIKQVGEKPEVEDDKTGKTAAFVGNSEITGN